MCQHKTSQEIFNMEKDGVVFCLNRCTWKCKGVFGEKIKDGNIVERYPNPIVVGEIVDKDLLGGIFGEHELLEVGWHDEDGEPLMEETTRMWVQTYGTWSPHTLDFLSPDQIKILGVYQGWKFDGATEQTLAADPKDAGEN